MLQACSISSQVMAAYGWSDISVPPYVLEVDGEGEPLAEAVEARQDFEDEVIDRLMALNEERAKAERRASAAAKKKTGKKSSGGQTSLL